MHSSHITFIGLLPRFLFFVKVPFRRWDRNHRSVPPLTNFLNLCRPPVGRDLRIRRSIPVLFSFSRSYNGHCRVPPFHLFPVSLVPRLRFPSIAEAFFTTSFLVLGFSFRLPPPNGKESSLFVPSFLLVLCRIPTAPCQPSLLLAMFYLFIGLPSFCDIETFFVCFFLFVALL